MANVQLRFVLISPHQQLSTSLAAEYPCAWASNDEALMSVFTDCELNPHNPSALVIYQRIV